jgi:hypothetical protein
MTAGPPTLERTIRDELAQPVPPGAHLLVERLRERYGPALRAVLLYGSCLRHHDDRESLLDLYALVGGYRAAYRGRTLAAMNRLLPPNVFYLEVPGPQHAVRAKYAVLALGDLARLVSPRTFEPYFWARFAQPCALVWAADELTRNAVAAALAAAVTTFVRRGAPLVGSPFDARELWTATWQATYGAEVRPERPGATDALYAAAADRYERVTALALPALPWPATEAAGAAGRTFRVDVPPRERRRAAWAWRLRRPHAKALFLLRILRNALTFEGGVDYVLWKIQRHSGVAIDQGWREKRHPLLALGAEAWRLYRARAFR